LYGFASKRILPILLSFVFAAVGFFYQSVQPYTGTVITGQTIVNGTTTTVVETISESTPSFVHDTMLNLYGLVMVIAIAFLGWVYLVSR